MTSKLHDSLVASSHTYRRWHVRPEHKFWHWFIVSSFSTLSLIVILGTGFNQRVSVDDYLLDWPSARAAQTVRHNYTIKSCYGGTNANNSCTSDADCSGGTCLPPVVARWNLDEPSGARAATGGSCGSDCNLTAQSTIPPGQNISNKQEGIASIDFSGPDNRWARCADATCDELDVLHNATVGCWAYSTDDTATNQMVNNLAGNGGYRINRLSSNDSAQVGIGDGTDVVSGSSNANTWLANAWTHVAFTFEDLINTAKIYINGEQKSTFSRQDLAGGTGDFYLSYTYAPQDWQGQIDECFVSNNALTNQQVCEICRFGLDGEESDRGAQCGSCDPGAAISPPSDATPPFLSNGSPTSQLPAGTTQTTLSLTTDGNSTCKYSTTAGTSYSSMPSTFSTTGSANHSTPITGLADGQSYTYYARCQDTANNPNTSDYPISFSVASSQSPDTTPPTVSITTPANNSTISGNVTVSANASDPTVAGQTTSGVAGVTFFYDFVNQIADILTAPFTTLWNTTAISNGIHTLIARVRDAAGNLTTSNPISVTVNNTSQSGNTYYVDFDGTSGVTCNDTNPGTSQSSPWCTIPGSRTTDNSGWLRASWGSISNTNKLTAGDTIWIKAGTTYSNSEGGRIVTNNIGGTGFWSHGTNNAPIQLKVHPAWGSGHVTIDCQGMTVGQWEGCVQSYKQSGGGTDWIYIRGASQSSRFIVINSARVGMITGGGVIGRLYEYVEVAWSGYFGIENISANGVTIKDSISHDNDFSGIVTDGASKNVTLMDVESYRNGLYTGPGYNNLHGINTFDSGTPDGQIVYLRVNSHDNIRDGFDNGLLNDTSGHNYTLLIDSKSLNNGEDGFSCNATPVIGGAADSYCSVVNSTLYNNRTSGIVCYSGNNANCRLTNSVIHGGVNACFGASGLNAATMQNSVCYKPLYVWGYGGGSAGEPTRNVKNSIFIPRNLDSDTYMYIRNPNPPPTYFTYNYDANISGYFNTFSANLLGISNPNNDSPSLFTAIDDAVYTNNNYMPGSSTSKLVDAGTPYCKITSPTSNGTTFNVDCDPRLYFFDNENRPLVEADIAYIGTGSGTQCTVIGLSATQITCASLVSWSNGDNVSRNPIYGSAPDIGVYEYQPPTTGTGNVYYVDPQNGNDANDGRSMTTAWKTIPGTWKRDGTDYLNAAWGNITKTNKLQPGDTVYLKGGGVQAEGVIWTCSGTENPKRCTGNVYNPDGFYEHGTASNPIRIMVHPTWASGNFVFDFSNTLSNPDSNNWGSPLFSVRSDYLWLEGASDAKRLKIQGCNLQSTNGGHWLLGFRGRPDKNLFSIGDLGRFLEVDGSQDTALCKGVDFSFTKNYTLANSMIHDVKMIAAYCISIGGQNDNDTEKGLIIDTETYKCDGGVQAVDSDDLVILRHKSHHNGVYSSTGTAGQDGRGFNFGGINGPATTNVSILESEAWGNFQYPWGFSACGPPETSCAIEPNRFIVAHSLGHGPTKDDANKLCLGLGDPYSTCTGVGTGTKRGSNFRCYGGANCFEYNNTHVGGEQSAVILGSDHKIGATTPTTFISKNTIYYPKAPWGTACYPGQNPLGTPIITQSNYTIWVPGDGYDNSGRMAEHSNAQGCLNTEVTCTFATRCDWNGSHDLVGSQYRPTFVNANQDLYSQNPADYQLKEGSVGIDQGDWYCKITSPSGTGNTFSTDCDPKEFFYVKNDYPGDFLAPDVAYIGIGTNRTCTIVGLTRSGLPGSPGTMTCTSPITWTQGEGVSRKPVYGTAPDIGAFEYASATPPPPPATFDFSLTNSGNLSVSQGSSATITVTATLVNGTPASLAFSASGLPTGITASFSPVSCTPSAGSGQVANCTFTLTLTTQPSTSLGPAVITITATSSSLAKTTTLTLTVFDTSAPTLTTTPTASGTTSTGATISFVTSEPTTATIEYGVTSQYGQTATSQPTPQTTHAITLANLQSGTTYHYRVKVKDASNNEVSSLDSTFATLPPVDTLAPSPITDLRLVSAALNSLNLTWTSSGDDATQGQAARYELRYATTPLDAATFAVATLLTGLPTPGVAGTTETYTAIGLTPSTTYYLALKATDDANLTSTISNILQASTTAPPPPSSGGGGYVVDTTPPSPATDLRIQAADSEVRLTWVNPSDSDFVRTTIVRKDGTTASTSFTDGTLVYEGTATSFTDTNLQNNQSYSYALFTLDRAGNRSQGAGLSGGSVIPLSGVNTLTTSTPALLEIRVKQGSLNGPNLGAVTITLAPSTGAPLSLTTDASGRQVFQNLVPGSYTLTLSKIGYRSYANLSFALSAGDNITKNLYLQSLSPVQLNPALARRLAGRILLQVQSKGEAWYVHPITLKRYYLGRPADAFRIMREQGLGITNANLSRVPEASRSGTLPRSLNHVSGRILLQVQSKGEAWYIHPVTLKRHYLGRPHDAFRIMREQGLGITDSDLAKIAME
ncbi:hypothetical protein A3D60_04140 [Candidatus Uhrbacteria bacterium RIFCSPHIGHO2_02_FULL_47_29]|uniref:Fibronectin type-III domain-containing protein n=1 Tax=Candidatus Uhrbacteria bacterium RIFCSPLOWO2_01_FULL_47_25 TaxID=1802402 RepID=A0A1F7UWB5_9BACT|nr:MAG: hypothetical protein A3D60_04140 [Candidatus Uhrbacteria bacterium RIFCSPHIGHO2_02_FULL_47_29]OGL82565.1 MAG: hypothetical protein A2936_03130 [Candidatus Uhrbacteria bacterium RIFCSPLOWO2_01_FULL_47_25]